MATDHLAFARRVTLLGSVLTALSSGTNYVYSAYAPQLGSRLHMTHTQLNIIGLSGNMGVYTTGPFLGRVTDKRGPRLLLITAGFLLFTGYTGLRAYYNAGTPDGEDLSLTSLLMMSLFSYMTGAGGNSGLTASANATAKSFPERMRATTVGLVISGFGLSAFFFSTLAHWLFPGNISLFLLFLSLGTSIPVIIGFLTIRPVPHAERPDAGPGGLTLPPDPDASDSSTHLLDQDSTNGGRGEEAGIDELLNVATVTGIHPELVSTVEMPRSRPPSFELSPARSDGVNRRATSSRRSGSRGKMPAQAATADIHGKRMLMGWEFWLLFAILSLCFRISFVAIYICILVINNVGSISQALSAQGNPNYDRIKAGKVQAAQVSVISLANCAARIGIGASADFAKNNFAAHRSYLLILVSILFIISQIVGSQVENVGHLWQASVILGLGYGGIFGLLPTITIEWFGLSHFSENWGFVSMAPLLGGNVFSILFGRNLDAHVTPASTARNLLLSRSELHLTAPLSDPDAEYQCLEGRACYAGAMGVTTFACVLALSLSLLAALRDRRRAVAQSKYENVVQEVIWEEDNEL